MKNYFLILLCSSLLITCKKGSGDIPHSLKNQKKRLIGEWILVRIDTNGTTMNYRQFDEYLTLNQDGSGSRKILTDGFSKLIYEKINWKIVNDSLFLSNTHYASPPNRICYIKKLKKDRMTLESYNEVTRVVNNITYFKDVTK